MQDTDDAELRLGRRALEHRLSKYLEGLEPSLLGETTTLDVGRVELLGAGTRHFNYLAVVNGRKYVARFSLTNHPESHTEYEYMGLRAVGGVGIAPVAYYHESSKSHLGLPFIIMEYVDGSHPESFTQGLSREIARVVALMHSIDTGAPALLPIRRKVGKGEILKVVEEKVDYISRKLAGGTRGADLALHIAEGYEMVAGLDTGNCGNGVLAHGDISLHNIVLGNGGLRLIDWETVSITDPAYDIATFFDRAGLPQQCRNAFMEEYVSASGRYGIPGRLESFEKIRVFDRMCWCIWEAIDLLNGRRHEFEPSWRSPDLYIRHAQSRMEWCQTHGLMPKGISVSASIIREALT